MTDKTNDKPARLIPAKVIFKPSPKKGKPEIGRGPGGVYVIKDTNKNCKYGCGVFFPRTDGEPESVLLEERVNIKRFVKTSKGSQHPRYYIAHKGRPSTEEEVKAMEERKAKAALALVPPPPFSVCIIPLTTEGQMGGAHLVGYKGRFLMFDCGGLANTQDWGEGTKQAQTAVRGLKKLARMWGNKPRIDAVFITHGHLDHHSNLKKMPLVNDDRVIPVLRTEITNAFITKSLVFDGYEPLPKGPENQWVFKAGQDFQVGEFHVTSFAVPHSIPDSVGYVIEVAGKRIVLLGDYKFLSPDPLETKQFQEDLDQIGSSQVDALVCEALGVDETGRTPDETAAIANIRKHIKEELSRAGKERRPVVIRFSCFSSHLYRIREVLKIALEFNLRPLFEGRAMEDTLFIGRHFFGFKELEAQIREKTNREGEAGLLFFDTGCQGEEGSALWRLTHSQITTEMGKKLHEAGVERPVYEISENDFVIISARVIPGNEERIQEVIDGVLERKGRILLDDKSVAQLQLSANYEHDDISTSGHGGSDDFLELFMRLKPRMVIPYHGTSETPQKLKELLSEPDKDKVATPERLHWIEI